VVSVYREVVQRHGTHVGHAVRAVKIGLFDIAFLTLRLPIQRAVDVETAQFREAVLVLVAAACAAPEARFDQKQASRGQDASYRARCLRGRPSGGGRHVGEHAAARDDKDPKQGGDVVPQLEDEEGDEINIFVALQVRKYLISVHEYKPMQGHITSHKTRARGSDMCQNFFSIDALLVRSER
jgi:hypothetical protein